MLPLIELLGGVRASIFAGLLALVMVFSTVQTLRLHFSQVAVTELQEDAAQLVLENKAAIATRDAEWAQYTNKLRGDYARENELAIQKRDAIIADLRSGNLRLRDKFRCPTVSTPAGSSGGSNDSETAGLQNEDAEFLVREADRADAVVRQLTLAQDIIAKCTAKKEQ